MDSNRHAVEAYWRSRMVDAVTTDEDKVAPVYKLEEICELLRSSHVCIVKEVSEYILKRLDHKSPVVKQKALRLIKYAVGKSGVEFQREMQRRSVVVRQLAHYKGYPDILKGDALNKAVRDTANETVSAIFDSDENKPVLTAGIGKRIEGFGNTNFEMPSQEKKSFLSEVVGFSSASIKQGLSNIASARSMRSNDNGTYKSPNLRRSLTNEAHRRDRYDGDGSGGSWSSSGVTKNATSTTWGHDSMQGNVASSENGGDIPSHAGVKSREERLLDTIVTSGGVRIQPTRDAIQVFLMEASKLDKVSMCHALESKLQSNLWQVRMKAVCILESLLRKNDEDQFVIASYFSENIDSVVKCSESPQVSFREKARKVLSLLDRENASGTKSHLVEASSSKDIPAPTPLPDLIDTGDPDQYGTEYSVENQNHHNNVNLTSTGSLVDDLFGGGESISSSGTRGSKNEEDPFADVSFHVSEVKEHGNDLFSGLMVVERRSHDESKKRPSNQTSELLDIFSLNSDMPVPESKHKNVDVGDLMAGLSINDIPPQNKQQSEASGGLFSEEISTMNLVNQQNLSTINEALNGQTGSSMVEMNPNMLFPMGYNITPSIMLNQTFASQPVNYGAMSDFSAQQQLLFQNLGNVNTGTSRTFSSARDGSYSSPLPDFFQISNNPIQDHDAIMTSSKKEETKAFNFISDHVSAARSSKRVL